MSKPVSFTVGDTITITEENIKTMQSSNRSCVTPQYPSDSYIKDISRFVGTIGTVTHRFWPGYEVTAMFQDDEGHHCFHVKDNWITKVKPTSETAQ